MSERTSLILTGTELKLLAGATADEVKKALVPHEFSSAIDTGRMIRALGRRLAMIGEEIIADYEEATGKKGGAARSDEQP